MQCRIALFLALGLAGAAHGATIRMLAPSSPDALAAGLQARGLQVGDGFHPNGPIRCQRGGSAEQLYLCKGTMADGARGGRLATVSIMVFRRYDFAQLDGAAKQALVRQSGARSGVVSTRNTLEFKDAGRSYALAYSCHQLRGPRNDIAYCLTAASANVMILTKVAPLHVGSRFTEIGVQGDNEDTERAVTLTQYGVEAVVRASSAVASPAPSKPKCTIWQVC